jgi:hypothetical protein
MITIGGEVVVEPPSVVGIVAFADVDEIAGLEGDFLHSGAS